ncbi:MAG: 3-phosphoserine/phosphohydroxythreonine transaminase [Crocinitomicaceae bacterium]|nr:3-phosphoserine/phosphohydroxythreonine transaminase [Crocinitomicaceae bacterium]
MKKVHNFSAGPCILPREVIEQSADALLDFDNLGLSLIEISHRSKNFEAVMEEARNLVKDILSLPERYDVLFLQGGATLGFYTVALNMLSEKGKAAYVNTGVWASGAIREAQLVGKVEVVGDSSDRNHSYIPSFTVPKDADYLHITSNNTIFGTQFQQFPESPVPMVCDMSSDIFSKKFDATKFSLIYAGAQKNMGPAGTVLYIMDKDQLRNSDRKLPAYMNLKLHAEKASMYNTPPVFAVYASMLTLRWIKNNGGLSGMEDRNRAKKDLFYTELDRNGLFHGHSAVADRSWMNPTFRLNDDTLSAEFDKMWKEAGVSGISGHRSVGGYRASMYNALPIESVAILVDVMKEFERRKG